MKNHPKLPITEERRNKAKYLTWNSIRLQYVKKTSMPNSVKSLGYIKCCSLSSLRPVKTPSNSIRNNCQKICSWSTRPKIILEITRWSTILLFISFSKTFYKFISNSKTKFSKNFIYKFFNIFYIYPQSSTEFLNILIASDLLMSWIIQW